MAVSASKEKYEVARPAGRCAVSGRQIAPEEKFMAALRETPAGFERVDVAQEHWDGFDKTGLLASWQAVMPRPEARKKLFVDDEILRSIFERLNDTAEPAKLNFRFVLGLILMRKRMLNYEATRMQGDCEVWVVRMKGQEQTLDLVNPRLTEEQVAEVSRQMSQIIAEEV